MPRDARKYLHDIREACVAITDVTSGRSLVEYESERGFRSSVEREFILIGEALRQLIDFDEAYESRITEARRIIGFRHQLVHGYDVVRNDAVWQIIEANMPILFREVSSLLSEWVGDGSE